MPAATVPFTFIPKSQSGRRVSADTAQRNTGRVRLTRQLQMLTCQRQTSDNRATRLMSGCRVYSGRSAGGHVPTIYYYNTRTRAHTHTHSTTRYCRANGLADKPYISWPGQLALDELFRAGLKDYKNCRTAKCLLVLREIILHWLHFPCP